MVAVGTDATHLCIPIDLFFAIPIDMARDHFDDSNRTGQKRSLPCRHSLGAYTHIEMRMPPQLTHRTGASVRVGEACGSGREQYGFGDRRPGTGTLLLTPRNRSLSGAARTLPPI